MNTLKTNFAVKSKYEAFYTGGRVQVSTDGMHMFCGCGNKVNVLEVATGKVQFSVGQEEDEEITSFCLTPNDQYIVVATQHLLLRQWNWREQKLIRSWKAIHFAPVVSMGFDCTSTLLATGSADSTVKLWDIEKQYCTHNLRGHQGIISVVAFHPDISCLQLYTAGEDYKVRVWNLKNSKCLAEIGAHYSLVTSICFSKDGNTIFTSGRDGVVAILDGKTFTVTRTVPVFEVIESVVLIPNSCDYPAINVDSGEHHFITAGNKGILRVWNANTGKCVYITDPVHTQQQSSTDGPSTEKEDDGQNIVQLVYNTTHNTVTVVTYDQNISILGVEKLRLQKQFAGNNDEILDVKYFGETGQYVVVATNSQHIKLFELDSWDCEILYGHTDIVLCIDVIENTNMFISAGKDNTVRLWKVNPALKEVSCLAVGQGHTNAVGALALSSEKAKVKFFVSGSEDCTLKLWSLPSEFDTSVTMEMHATVTERAHEKTISSVVIAPNDKFVATGSMDKTAKLWDVKDLSLIGVMRGHKRGIWCVQFSPIDQVLASSSGDGVVKLWSLTDFSCVRTFEGHDCAVLKVTFITRGMQLLTTGTNGLVKLWTIKTNECVKTLDEHEDKVWALAVGAQDNTFITGGADSSLIVWKDITETEDQESREKQEQFILQEQELSNLIHQKKYLKAIGLAITLEQPFRLLNILKEIMSEEKGDEKLYDTIMKLRMDQIDVLLRFCGQWNTNSRHCHEAQVVVSSILKMYPPSQLKQLGNLKSSVEGLVPYTERHFNRMSRLAQQAMFLQYTWQCMKGISSDSVVEGTDMAVSVPTSLPGTAADDTDDESSSESEVEMEVMDKTRHLRKPEGKESVSERGDTAEDKNLTEKVEETVNKQSLDTSQSSETGRIGRRSVERIKLGTESESSGESSSESEDDDEDDDDELIGGKLGQEVMDINTSSEESDSESEADDELMPDKMKIPVTENRTEPSSDTDEDVNDVANMGKGKILAKKPGPKKTLGTKKGVKVAEKSGSKKNAGKQKGAKVKAGQLSKTEAPPEAVSPANIHVNLFKDYMTKENKKPSKAAAMEEKGRKSQKRKVTDQFTVVKGKGDKCKKDNSDFTIDRTSSKIDLNVTNKTEITKKRKLTKNDRLKKLKKPGKR